MHTTDILGEPWTVETIPLPDDDEGAVVTTLVHRPRDDGSVPAQGAVLHVHGFADYFFHTEYAEWWTARGYDFYAVDLQKYGRSWLPHQTPTYTGDLRGYFDELDLVWQRITERDAHSRVVVSAHSTGGLTMPLWAHHRRPERLVGMVLNSPWLDLQGAAWLRTPVAGLALDRLGQRQPMREIKRDVSGLYGRSLHRDHQGEWAYDLRWKPLESFALHVGWLRAIRRGHSELHRGLDVPAPVLVLSSGASSAPTGMGDEVHSTDIVLDVAQIRRWSTAIGRHITYVAIDGAMHDVVLSRSAPRARVYGELARWSDAYLSPPTSDSGQ